MLAASAQRSLRRSLLDFFARGRLPIFPAPPLLGGSGRSGLAVYIASAFRSENNRSNDWVMSIDSVVPCHLGAAVADCARGIAFRELSKGAFMAINIKLSVRRLALAIALATGVPAAYAQLEAVTPENAPKQLEEVDVSTAKEVTPTPEDAGTPADSTTDTTTTKSCQAGGSGSRTLSQRRG